MEKRYHQQGIRIAPEESLPVKGETSSGLEHKFLHSCGGFWSTASSDSQKNPRTSPASPAVLLLAFLASPQNPLARAQEFMFQSTKINPSGESNAGNLGSHSLSTERLKSPCSEHLSAMTPAKLIFALAVLLLTCLQSFTTATHAHAEGSSDETPTISGRDTQPGSLGFYLGVNQPSTDGTLPAAAIGVSGATRVNSHFGLGLFVTYYGERATSTFLTLPEGTQMSIITALAQANLLFGGLHLGAEVGATLRSWGGALSTLNGGTSTTTLTYGPNAGYDYKLSRNFSLGAELHYLIAGAAPEVNHLQAFAVAKLWL